MLKYFWRIREVTGLKPQVVIIIIFSFTFQFSTKWPPGTPQGFFKVVPGGPQILANDS